MYIYLYVMQLFSSRNNAWSIQEIVCIIQLCMCLQSLIVILQSSVGIALILQLHATVLCIHFQLITTEIQEKSIKYPGSS